MALRLERLEAETHLVRWQQRPSLDVGAASDWVLDSFAWFHRTSHRQMLYDIQERAEDLLLVPGKNRLQILEHGSVRTERFKVPNVRYYNVAGDARNVISMAQLASDHGFVTVFEPTCCYVKDKKTGQLVGKGRLHNGTYVLDYLRIDQDEGGGGAGAGDSGGDVSGDEGGAGKEEKDKRQPPLQWPQAGTWFGSPRRFNSAVDSTMDAYQTKNFMDSGACHHVTSNADVLKAYHADLQIKPPIKALYEASGICHDVVGIGYIDSAGGSLDRVLFVPDSPVNLVSISQLTQDYSVRVVFNLDVFWIEKLETEERIGFGRHTGLGYEVAHLDVGAASVWVLDSFSWFHYTSHRQMLYDIQERVEDLSLFPGKHQLQILEHGSLRTERFKVPNVSHYNVPGYASNVISIAQLAFDHGFVTVLERTCYVKDKKTGKLVGKGHLRNSTYVLDYLRID